MSLGGDGSQLAGLEEHIRMCRDVMSGSTSTSNERRGQLKTLADAHMSVYHVSHSLVALEEAIALYEEALKLGALGRDECRAEYLNDLGSALFLFCWFHATDNPRRDHCIDYLREALQLCPAGHPSRGNSLHNLARALHFLGFENHMGGRDALDEAITLHREALQLRPAGHPDRDKTLNDLAYALMKRFQQYGDIRELTEAIAMHREALQLRRPGHVDRAKSLNNLSLALGVSFDILGGFGTLAESISLLREAVQLRPPGHPLRVTTLDNLASTLMNGFRYHGHLDTLMEAVCLHREALQLMPDAHSGRSRMYSNVALTLLSTFRAKGDSSALLEAISLLRKALSMQAPGHPFRDQTLDNLAEALYATFEEHRDSDILRETIDLYREVLQSRPRGHWERFHSLEQLGRLLCERQCQSFPEALSLFREGLHSCPTGYPARSRLLCGMSICFLDPCSSLFNFEEGMFHLREAYTDEISHINQRVRSAASDLRRLEEAYTVAAKGAGPSYAVELSDKILHLYALVIGLLPRAANFGLDHNARLDAVAGSDEIARNAASRALILGRVNEALELLEAGRGVFWSQSLCLRTTAFANVPEIDRQELERLFFLLDHGARRLEGSNQTPLQRERDLETRRQLNATAEALIDRIRGYPGLGRFLLPPAFEELISALPNGFVVFVNASKLGHHALLLSKALGLAQSLELKPPQTGFDSTTLRSQLPRDIIGAPDHESLAVRAMRLKKGGSGSLVDALALLWTSIVHPVINKLGLQASSNHARPRLWWCVTGELSFLPIHAAGRYRDTDPVCIADYVVSSYIPTLSSLHKARSEWKSVPRTELAGLLVCEASSGEGPARHLPNAANEVHIVRDCFASAQAHVLNEPSAHTSLSGLRTLLKETPAHILHLACHGIQDSNPLKSAILLQDGRLTIEDIMQLHLPHAVLAFLSACQTAKGDRNAPDQAVHLAASMLFCGFRSVIGTMWLMHDEDGPKVARRVYEALFERDSLDLDDIPYALDEAVQALRRAGVPASRWALFMHMGG